MGDLWASVCSSEFPYLLPGIIPPLPSQDICVGFLSPLGAGRVHWVKGGIDWFLRHIGEEDPSGPFVLLCLSWRALEVSSGFFLPTALGSRPGWGWCPDGFMSL